MRRFPVLAAVGVGLLLSAGALAGERTVTLAVANMTCASCPYIVKKTLARVPGVTSVEVSYEKKTAVVTFDDAVTNVAALTAATADAGYPATPIAATEGEGSPTR